LFPSLSLSAAGPRALKPPKLLESLTTTLALTTAVHRLLRLDQRISESKLVQLQRRPLSEARSERRSFQFSFIHLFYLRRKSSVTRLREDQAADAAGAPAHLTRYVFFYSI
jgi:hypothetical protein